MPALKQRPPDKDTMLRGIIAMKMELRKMRSKEALAKAVGIPPRTMYTRMEKPSTFTRRELMLLFRTLEFTDEEKAKVL